MTDESTGTKRKTFARCVDCGNEVAAMKRDDGSLVTPHEVCQDCGGTEFEEADREELDELADHADWADRTVESVTPEADE